MKRQDNLFISKLVDKVLNETIEERANSLVSKLKHKEMKEGGSRIKGLINQMKGEVNEHGMDDVHPFLGGERFKEDMSNDEIDDILNQLRMGDDDDFEDGVDEMPPFKRDRDYEDDDFDNEWSHFDVPHHAGQNGHSLTAMDAQFLGGHQARSKSSDPDSLTSNLILHTAFGAY